MVKDSLIPFDSHKILKLAEKMKWDEAIIDGSSKVQNYLLNAIMVIEKKNSLSENGLDELHNCWSEKDCRCLLLKEIILKHGLY